MTNNIQNKNTILKQLEWDLFYSKVNSLSLFKDCAQRVLSNEVSHEKLEDIFSITDTFLDQANYEEVVAIYLKLTELDEDHFGASSGAKLAKGVIFDLKELSHLIRLLEIAHEHRKFLNASFAPFDIEEHDKFRQYFQRKVLREFRTFVTKEGEVDFFKHPRLKELYKRQLEIETGIRSLLGKLKHTEKFEKALQFESHDVINDKYVLPVRSDSFSSSLGSIVARSESGRTLFVEPMELRQQNLARLETILKIDQIVHEIARDFSQRLAPYSNIIDQTVEQVFLFDEFQTRSKFALEYGLNRPTLIDNHSIELDNFFHPLIENPVKNSITINYDDKGLVISGPNTGGKTAAIKAIALSCFFLKHGLFVPARRAQMFNFENVFYFGNDQQSLEQGLSSFAAEVKNYTQLLKLLGESNLVIIDEIFNSTSSEEASALAFAFFEEITKSQSSKIIVSTHHQTLKTMAHAQNEYLSCHVGFNAEINQPTYKLVFGSPGSSLAIDIFKKLSGEDPICEQIYKEATKRLDNKMINYEKLLHSLSEREGKLSKLVDQNEQINKELKNQKEAAKGIIQLKVDEEVTKLRQKLSKIEQRAEQALQDAKNGEINSSRANRKRFSSIESELTPFVKKEDTGQRFEKFKDMPKPKELVVGSKYFCSFVNQTVTLKEIKNAKTVIVTRGALNIKCPADSLHIPNKSYGQKVVVTAQRSSHAKIEYDCRGMRLHEFQNIVENAIPDLLSGNVPYINVIHGHGNGTLKKWLRDFIKNSKTIEWDKAETGNDGETRIIAK
ncbi:MAG: Smr/MutS family protein [Bacteriovoracaceae bacterium]|nr:Smr/MutS family protein [Bacteriovoracaceae bacterium]